MNDRELIDLITRKVLEQVQVLPCEGCDMQTCDGERACHITAQQNQIPVGVSARHAHLTKEHLEQFYADNGTGAEAVYLVEKERVKKRLPEKVRPHFIPCQKTTSKIIVSLRIDDRQQKRWVLCTLV